MRKLKRLRPRVSTAQAALAGHDRDTPARGIGRGNRFYYQPDDAIRRAGQNHVLLLDTTAD
jgi:hypothetical protein